MLLIKLNLYEDTLVRLGNGVEGKEGWGDSVLPNQLNVYTDTSVQLSRLANLRVHSSHHLNQRSHVRFSVTRVGKYRH